MCLLLQACCTLTHTYMHHLRTSMHKCTQMHANARTFTHTHMSACCKFALSSVYARPFIWVVCNLGGLHILVHKVRVCACMHLHAGSLLPHPFASMHVRMHPCT